MFILNIFSKVKKKPNQPGNIPNTAIIATNTTTATTTVAAGSGAGATTNTNANANANALLNNNQAIAAFGKSQNENKQNPSSPMKGNINKRDLENSLLQVDYESDKKAKPFNNEQGKSRNVDESISNEKLVDALINHPHYLNSINSNGNNGNSGNGNANNNSNGNNGNNRSSSSNRGGNQFEEKPTSSKRVQRSKRSNLVLRNVLPIGMIPKTDLMKSPESKMLKYDINISNSVKKRRIIDDHDAYKSQNTSRNYGNSSNLNENNWNNDNGNLSISGLVNGNTNANASSGVNNVSMSMNMNAKDNLNDNMDISSRANKFFLKSEAYVQKNKNELDKTLKSLQSVNKSIHINEQESNNGNNGDLANLPSLIKNRMTMNNSRSHNRRSKHNKKQIFDEIKGENHPLKLNLNTNRHNIRSKDNLYLLDKNETSIIDVGESFWSRYSKNLRESSSIDDEIKKVEFLFNRNEHAFQNLNSIRESLLGLYIKEDLTDRKNYRFKSIPKPLN